jgi:radical SAM superfamily enzyme YgiQ (UPF0313 family)
VATAAGHEVRIYDPKRLIRDGTLPYDQTLYERVADALLRECPDAVGFTTLGCSFLFVVGVGRVLERRAPDLPVLLGGPHATMLAKPILERYSPFDIVVRHEAEKTLPAVLANLERRDFSQIPGLTWRTRAKIEETPGSPRIDDLDTLPWLDYGLYPIHELCLDLLRVEAGRGCPFACYFCSTATFFQRRYRLKSPERIVAEMDALRDHYAPPEFKLDHDLFTVDRRKVRAFCDAVQGSGHRWRVSARVDCVDEELLERMAAAGCVGLYFGMETGSRRMQRISAKRLDLDLVRPTLDMCERLGIEVTASFITGYPEEAKEDQDATLSMLGDCFRRPAVACLPQLHILTPEPGTSLFDRLGEALQFDGYATPFNSWLLRPEDQQEVLRDPAIFASYYYYPAELPRQTHVAVVETVDLLRRLDRRVLAALIGLHSRGLAELMRCLIATIPETSQAPGVDQLEDYVRDLCGDDHPITSAVRYTLFASTVASSAVKESASLSEPFDPGARYRLPADARILDKVHDCSQVLEWLDNGGRTVNAAAWARVSYVRLSDGDPPLRVEPGLVTLLQLFGAGRSAHSVLESLPGVYAPPETWLKDLVAAGLLVRVEKEPGSGVC